MVRCVGSPSSPSLVKSVKSTIIGGAVLLCAIELDFF
jgi:hypothetical protein